MREWARLLKPGGRLLYTDACVLTGPVAKAGTRHPRRPRILPLRPARLTSRPSPPPASLLRREDRTAACADIAGRWHDFRARHAEALEREEGAAWYARRQRFLATTAELAGSGRLSRLLYVVEKRD